MSDIAAFEAALRKRFGNRYKRGRGKNGLEFKVCCPFCPKNVGKADTKFHLQLNPEKEVFNCFRCGESGRLSDLFGEIRRAENETPVLPEQYTVPPEVEVPGQLMHLSELAEDHPCRRYLRRRKFDHRVLEKYYGVRYCWEGRPFAGGLFNTSNTLVFPIWMQGRLIGWQARLLYDPDELTDAQCAAMGVPPEEDGSYPRPPKYFTAPGMDKGRVLFNYDMARTSDIVVVCEGPFDSVAVGPCAVATLGKGVTDAQARILKAYWKLVVILLDPGDADREMRQLQGRMQVSVPTVRVDLQGYKDAGDTPTVEIWRQIDATVQSAGLSLTDYTLGPHWGTEVLTTKT